jgi:predicted RNA-binding protein YlxR (DUF448 family)
MTPRAAARDRAAMDEEAERRCVASREPLPASEMIRFVADPEGRLVADIRRKLPGRGVWTATSREAVLHAQKTGAFARSLKAKVAVSPTLADEVDALLARDALQAFAMANKAGLAVFGFSKVESLAGSRAVAAVIEASDGAEDSRRKLMQALRRGHGAAADAIPVVDCFVSGDLALALGRELVIHAGLKTGAASGAFLERWRRLVHFRTRPLPQKARPAGASPLLDSTAGPTSE